MVDGWQRGETWKNSAEFESVIWMKITNFDTDLILALMDMKGGGSTTDLAKALFKPKDEYELRKRDNKIRYRLERMRKKGLLQKNGVTYKVNVERVFLTPAALHLAEIDVAVNMGMMLVVYPKDDKIMMRQITYEKLQENKGEI